MKARWRDCRDHTLIVPRQTVNPFQLQFYQDSLEQAKLDYAIPKSKRYVAKQTD
jgi:hypothetical protein